MHFGLFPSQLFSLRESREGERPLRHNWSLLSTGRHLLRASPLARCGDTMASKRRCSCSLFQPQALPQVSERQREFQELKEAGLQFPWHCPQCALVRLGSSATNALPMQMFQNTASPALLTFYARRATRVPSADKRGVLSPMRHLWHKESLLWSSCCRSPSCRRRWRPCSSCRCCRCRRWLVIRTGLAPLPACADRNYLRTRGWPGQLARIDRWPGQLARIDRWPEL
jgi:hypothetical protein